MAKSVQHGISLIESVVTLLIVSISVLAVMTLLTRSIAGRNADLQHLRTLRENADTAETDAAASYATLRLTNPNGGFTLVELLVAMTLGLSIAAGAMHMFNMTMSTWRSVEAVAGLEERLAFAMRAIEDDVLLAGYRGVTPLTAPVTPSTAQCRGWDVSAWALAIDRPLQTYNNVTTLPCPFFTTAEQNSDALIVRHHDAFSDAPVMQMHGWYVDRQSSLPGQPSLRRQTLLPNGNVQTQEIIPGIEDLQLQLGMDRDNDGHVDDWVDEDSSTDPLLMVQVKLGVRSALRENGVGGDGFRRINAQRRFFLRNGPG